MSAAFGSPEHRAAVLEACGAARAALAQLAAHAPGPPGALALDLAESWARGERPRHGEDTDVFFSVLREAIDEGDREADRAAPDLARAIELAADAADSVNDPRLAALARGHR